MTRLSVTTRADFAALPPLLPSDGMDDSDNELWDSAGGGAQANAPAPSAAAYDRRGFYIPVLIRQPQKLYTAIRYGYSRVQ